MSELLAFLAGAITFVTRYLAVRGWWRSAAGRHMMVFSATIGIFIGALAAEFASPGQLIPLWGWAVILVLPTILMWGQVVLLFKVQNERRETIDE